MMGHLILGRGISDHRNQASSLRTPWMARMVQAIFRRRH